MIKIEFDNGSSIHWHGRNQSKDVIRGIMSEDMHYNEGKEYKFIDNEGEETIPMESDILNAIVGYNHNPETHNYNRAERRRIIKAAKKLEKQMNQKNV